MYERNTHHSLTTASKKFSVIDEPCAYMPLKKMTINHREVDVVTMGFVSKATNRGWRRFGRNYIYPQCASCNECKSLRIDVLACKYSKSQRKTINKNEHTKIVAKEPMATQEHINLYNKYHTYKSKKNGWSHTNISREEYYETYVNGAFEFGKELRYYIDDKLVCVDLIDILEDGISAIYCYYDPEYLHLSLGRYSLLYQIDLAKNLGLKWVYIGNWIEGYKDFEYKENFKPLEVLENFPRISEKAIWKPFRKKK